MLYFLIILVPFLGAIGYLVYQNKLLKKQYKMIEEKLYALQKTMHLEHVPFPMGINRDFVVTSNSIKRLENFIMALEDSLGIQKMPVVSNTFKPKKEKLAVLYKRAAKMLEVSSALQKAAQSPLADPIRP
jgi:hypothetical protein